MKTNWRDIMERSGAFINLVGMAREKIIEGLNHEMEEELRQTRADLERIKRDFADADNRVQEALKDAQHIKRMLDTTQQDLANAQSDNERLRKLLDLERSAPKKDKKASK